MAQEKGRDPDGKDAPAKDGSRKGDKSAQGDKGDDYEFIPPDFDEDAFIHREMVSFRTTFILFFWGILAAAVSWGIFYLMDGARTGWLVGLVVATVFFLGLKRVFNVLKVDIKHFGKREWFGTAALYFFTWLSFFIIAINPPVSDFAAPRVELHASPLLQEADDPVTIDLFVEDNRAVSEYQFRLERNGQILASEGNLEDLGRGHYRYSADNLTPGSYQVSAFARDGTGHASNHTVHFAVVERLLQVTLPEGGRLDQATDQVLVRSTVAGFEPCNISKGRVTNHPCVRTVQLAFNDGRAMALEHSATFGGWQATSNFAGWREGANNFTVVLQMMPSFAGSAKLGGGNVTAGPFELDVDVTNNPLGFYVSEVLPEPTAPRRSVPGLELPLVAFALLGALLVARRRNESS